MDYEDKWYARVEFLIDSKTHDVEASWIHDFDMELCPAFDPFKIYRVFWSPFPNDTPATAKQRMPAIPLLSESEEKKNKAGYYRANILCVEDSAQKLEDTRTRKKSSRAGQVLGAADDSLSSSQKGTRKGGSAQKTVRVRGGKRADCARRKAKTADSNICPSFSNNVFLNDAVEASDDEEAEDTPQLEDKNSDIEIKVLRAAVKNLKQSVLQRSSEMEALKQKLAEKDEELLSLRSINLKLQNEILGKLPHVLSNKSVSLSSLPVTSPSRPRYASASTSHSGLSSVSSSLSEVSNGTNSSDVEEAQSHFGNVSLKKNSKEDTTARPVTKPMVIEVPPSPDGISDQMGDVPDVLSFSEFEDVLIPSTSIDLTKATIVKNVEIDVCDALGKNDLEARKVTSYQNKVSLVEFCPGVKVDKNSLDIILKYDKHQKFDAKFIKDLATLVFGSEVLKNSSVTGRKCPTNKQAESRPKLDETLVRAIGDRLKKRVTESLNGAQMTTEDYKRCSASVVNIHLKEKIKKLRLASSRPFVPDDTSA